MSSVELEHHLCPYCGGGKHTFWATERGFNTVKCNDCAYLFLNPRPNAALREKATQLGVHGAANDMDIREHYVPSKVTRYRKILKTSFADVWSRAEPVTWLDIGAGYGEVVEAVATLAPKGSRVMGLEPMTEKARAAQQRGINIVASFVGPDTPKSRFVSLIDVFSHINDFDAFLTDVANILEDEGEFFIETGDMGDIGSREEFPGELGLPDHVAFANSEHLCGFLKRNQFDIISIDREQIDDYAFTFKNVIKKAIGRNVILKMPYTSPFRTLRVRARKRPVK